jgi:hypothetical protein
MLEPDFRHLLSRIGYLASVSSILTLTLTLLFQKYRLLDALIIIRDQIHKVNTGG